ncbi:MAG: hypothetical protein FJZ92_07010 [Chloroflexi bacterium]|nr:hypothetical protein [Chloroflexota bacterium]
MGLGLAIVVILLIGLVLGFMVIQATFAARKWRQVIAAGDRDALEEILDMTFEAWRGSRPPRGMPPADWRALHTAAVVAADRDRCRVSLIADPDVRVVGGRRVEAGSAADVARRAAVRMAERLLYDIPHVRFEEVQVDVFAEYRAPDGASQSACLLTTRALRADSAQLDWDADAVGILATWRTREANDAAGIDPEGDALITEAEIDAVRAAEETLRRSRGGEGG